MPARLHPAKAAGDSRRFRGDLLAKPAIREDAGSLQFSPNPALVAGFGLSRGQKAACRWLPATDCRLPMQRPQHACSAWLGP